MKKTLLTFFFAIAATFAMAQTTAYSDNLIVTIDGESADPQETTIFVEQNTDGTYKLALNNFHIPHKKRQKTIMMFLLIVYSFSKSIPT